MTDGVSAASFDALVGSTFRVVGPWDPDPSDDTDEAPGADAPDESADEQPTVTLTMTKVVRLDHAGPFEQFRAIFVGPRATPLDQDTFVLDPAPGGIEALLLVPTAERDDEREYTASLSVRRSSTESVAP